MLEAVISGGTEIESDLFEAKLMKWKQKVPRTGKTAIQAQFEVLYTSYH